MLLYLSHVKQAGNDSVIRSYFRMPLTATDSTALGTRGGSEPTKTCKRHGIDGGSGAGRRTLEGKHFKIFIPCRVHPGGAGRDGMGRVGVRWEWRPAPPCRP